jgi:hypothetical protein
MFLITLIKSVDRAVYVTDEYHDGHITSLLVGAFYDLHVSVNNENLIFEGGVCPGPHAPQLGWSDEFQDLMMEHQGDFNAVNRLLFDFHSGESVTFPVTIGRVV